MNREIKFRAWDGAKMISCGIVTRITDSVNVAIFDGYDRFYTRDYPVMQFTGIKDFNGEDIYFDDVVRIAGYGNLHVDDLGALMILVDAVAENDIGEIRGNIYEDKELLEWLEQINTHERLKG